MKHFLVQAAFSVTEEQGSESLLGLCLLYLIASAAEAF
jgi:hypothetical protein